MCAKQLNYVQVRLFISVFIVLIPRVFFFLMGLDVNGNPIYSEFVISLLLVFTKEDVHGVKLLID